MSSPAAVDAPDAATALELARKALTEPTAELVEWTFTPLSHLVLNPASGGFYRLAGTARYSGSRDIREWSAILKVIRVPQGVARVSGVTAAGGGDDDPTHPYYWRREFEAYRSGLVHQWPDAVVAPRCFGTGTGSDGTLHLWLEEVQGVPGSTWGIADFETAAYHLGIMNAGAVVNDVRSTYPWLSQRWLARFLEMGAWTQAYIRDPALWETLAIKDAFPATLAPRLASLWDGRQDLLGALERLPQTLCHFDAHALDLFARRRASGAPETVAIDWAFIGPGAVGEDLAACVSMSLALSPLWRLPLGVEQAGDLDRRCFAAYLAGLAAAGWVGDERLVRFAFAAHACLRAPWALALLLRDAADPAQREAMSGRVGVSFEERLAYRAALQAVLNDWEDEARRLLPFVLG